MKDKNVIVIILVVVTVITFAFVSINIIRLNNIKKCIQEAENSYNTSWAENCEFFSEGPNCTLPNNWANDLKEKRENDKDRCIEIYN